MRKTITQQPLITRSQFLRPKTRFQNHISVEPPISLAPVLPYVGQAGFTPISSFFEDVSHDVMRIEADSWRLSVGGLVAQPSRLSLDEIQAMPAVEKAYTLAAITSTPNNLLMGHGLWRGVPLKQVLDKVGVRPDAQYVQFRSANGYATYLPIEKLNDSILAYTMNGEALPVEQGYPVRLIVPGVYNYKMPKWIQTIELVAQPSTGHYESRGWSADGVVQTTSAIFAPRPREVVSGKEVFSGMAFAGTRAITQIELSIDDGNWMPVPFEAAESGSWTRWQIDWLPPASGDYLVKVRATDSAGFTQPDSINLPVFPNGSSVIHSVVFRVSM